MPPSRRPTILLIEPDDIWRIQLRNAAASAVTVETCADYHSASRRIGPPYTYIVTNIRLVESNGLQLVYLAHDTHPGCRAIAYTDERDVWLAREAQRAGPAGVRSPRSGTTGPSHTPAHGRSPSMGSPPGDGRLRWHLWGAAPKRDVR